MRALVAGGEQEKQHFLERNVSPYYEMVDLLIGQNRFAEALTQAERAKARALLDVLEGGRVNITGAMTREEQERERGLRAELVSLNSQFAREKQGQKPDQALLAGLGAKLEKARLEYESYQGTLYSQHPELRVQRGRSEPFSLDEFSVQNLGANTAWLEYVVLRDKTLLFVLTRKSSGGAADKTPRESNAGQPGAGLRVYTINMSEKDLAARVKAFTGRVASRQSGLQPLSSQLYELLVKPARAQLRGITNVVVVPDGVLWELPFQALQPAAAHYLIQDYAVSYAPSLTVLREMKKHRSPAAGASPVQNTLLAVGNPAIGARTADRVKAVFMDEKLVPLPQAERQVNLLRDLYGRDAASVYVGPDAREGRVKQEANRYRILHLATHGILNNNSPMYSHLVLSQDEHSGEEDGLLEAWEIMSMDLKADLVVLSACETARGRFGAGEGVIGLTWALFVAGCPASVVSQWKVEASSTTELMIEFHRNLVAGDRMPSVRVTKSESLRRAALKLLRGKKYSHPFYWAPFVLIGDGG